MTNIEDLAPYPEQADATVDAFARHETVEAFINAIRSDGVRTRASKAGLGSPEMLAYAHSLRTLCAQVGVIHLLRAFKAAAPEQAEEAARQLWDLWDDGAGDEWLADLVDGYGIDSGQIIEQVIAEQEAGL